MHPRATIERYVVDGLPDAEERELRRHLRECEECRAFYDAQRLLMRALSGDANQPTQQELKLHSALAARAVFPPEPASAQATKQQGFFAALFERLFSTPSRAFAIGAAVFAVILIVALVPRREIDAPMPLAASVMKVNGVTLDGEPLSEQGELRALQIIQVEKGGMLELALLRGGTLRIYPESRLSLGARGESVVLERGKIWCLPEEGRGDFEVSTSTATVRVLGTSFIVEANDEKTDVRVVSGSVEVIDAEERGLVKLQKEESTRVDRGRAPSPPRRASTQADRNEWQRFIDDLLRGLNDGVRKLDKAISDIQKGAKR